MRALPSRRTTLHHPLHAARAKKLRHEAHAARVCHLAGGRRKARTAITTVKYEAGPSADAKAAEDAARSPPNHAAVGMGPTTPPVAASTKVPASAHASTPPISPLVDVDGVACAPAAAAASKGAYAPDADFDAFFTAPPAGMAPAAAPATDSSLLDLLGSPTPRLLLPPRPS